MLHAATIRIVAMAVTSALCLPFAIASAQAAEDEAETGFPYVLQVESGAAEFDSGDQITITSVRGNRAHLEPGGRYRLEGSYTLASADSADLAWYATTRGPSGSKPVTNDEHTRIVKGSGKFHLEKTLLDDGWLHVSFWVNDHSHGGIYFGEKGFENTVLRKKGWSDFSNDSPGTRPDRKSAAAHLGGITLSDPANLAIMAYLGDPVPPPAGLDASYSPTNLMAAFTTLSRNQGLQIKRLAVDNSEFPFLVYGVLAGKCEFRVLQAGLQQMKGYDYGGSVVGSTDQGGTYFALNMIPHNQYPSCCVVACNRRLMVRLQLRADSFRQEE